MATPGKIVVEIDLDEPEQMKEKIVAEAVNQLLKVWKHGYNEEGEYNDNDYRIDSPLANNIKKAVVAEIRDEVGRRVPEFFDKLLERQVQLTDEYGYHTGREKHVEELIVDEVNRKLNGSNNGRGNSLVASLIKKEVEDQLTKDIKDAIDVAKAPIIEAVRVKAADIFTQAVVASLGK